MFYGQHGEDKFMNALFSEDYKGVCVEVGAYNGESCSNTYFFENKGWSCLCIEPIPSQYEKCKVIRKNCVNYAVSDSNKEDVPFMIFNIGDDKNESAMSSLDPDTRLIKSHKHMINSTVEIKVKCRTLTSILDDANFSKEIDFISIDTENTELNVLKGFDFSKYSVKYFIIENNFNEPACEDYLKEFGYIKLHRIAVNDIFYKESLDKYNSFHGEIQHGKHVDQTLREYFPDYSYKGTMLDIGAYEPINISNSYHFEKNGYNVVCFEANTSLIPILKADRANVYNYAISYEDKDIVTFNVVHGSWGGGSLTAGISAIELDPQYLQQFHSGIRSIEQISIPQKSLNSCLPEILKGSTQIDIVSIDVEGGELNVLKGLDLNKYKVKVFVIENVYKNTNIGEFLDNYGYKLDKRIEYNEYYIKLDAF
jgi:FkbM family methyltransferase